MFSLTPLVSPFVKQITSPSLSFLEKLVFPIRFAWGERVTKSYNLVAKISLLSRVLVLPCGQAPVNYQLSGWAFCIQGTLQTTCWLHTECLIYLLCDWLIWGNFLLLGICHSWNKSPQKFQCCQVHLWKLAEAEEVCGLGINMALHLASNKQHLFGEKIWGTNSGLTPTIW